MKQIHVIILLQRPIFEEITTEKYGIAQTTQLNRMEKTKWYDCNGLVIAVTDANPTENLQAILKVQIRQMVLNFN